MKYEVLKAKVRMAIVTAAKAFEGMRVVVVEAGVMIAVGVDGAGLGRTLTVSVMPGDNNLYHK